VFARRQAFQQTALFKVSRAICDLRHRFVVFLPSPRSLEKDHPQDDLCASRFAHPAAKAILHLQRPRSVPNDVKFAIGQTNAAIGYSSARGTAGAATTL
jgi:hypothetical protein